MHRSVVHAVMAILATSGSSFAEATAPEDSALVAEGPTSEEDASNFGGGVSQSASWSEDADPSWYHTTSAQFFWTPGSGSLGIDELRVGVDLIGADFQFDSLWAVEPNAGLSWSQGLASLDLDAWITSSEGDTLSDKGFDAELAFALVEGEHDLVSLALSGSLTEASGSEAGAGIRWMRTNGRYRFNAGIAATRRWEVDVSALAQNLPRRLAPKSYEGDQWVFGGNAGVRILLGEFAISPRLSAAATRSEMETSRSTGKGKRGATSGTTTSTLALWSLDATPSVRLAWNRGVFDIATTLGSTSSWALSSKGETEAFQPWVSLSAGVGW